MPVEKDGTDIKCPKCGRKKAVEEKEPGEYFCTHCKILFDGRGDE